MNHKWNYRPITPEQAETSQTLAQELGISPILGQLLVQRGITKAADAKKFFRPQLPDLHDCLYAGRLFSIVAAWL